MHLYDTCKFFNNYFFCPHIKVTIVAFQDKVKVLGWLIRGLCLHPYTRRGAEGGKDGCCDRCNQLHDKLCGFFLCHYSPPSTCVATANELMGIFS